MTDNERIHPRELIAEYALGVLSEGEAARVRAFLETDADAMAEYEEMANVARLLPMAAEASEPSTDLLPGVLSRIAAEPVPISRARSFRQARWWPVAGAAAAVLLVAVGIGGFAIGRSGDGTDGELQAQVDEQSELLASVAIGQFESHEARDGDVRVAVVRAPGESKAYTYVEGLPDLGEGQAYQSWFIEEGADPIPGPLFSTGNGSVWLEADESLDAFSALAFTVEQEDGADAPSQAPFVIVPLQTAARR